MVRLAGQHKVFEDEIRVLCDTIGHNRERLAPFPGIPEHCKVEHVASVRRERGRRHSFYLGFHVFIYKTFFMSVSVDKFAGVLYYGVSI